jgi:16S rRNA (guanine527-N7)-methyltransferase
MSNHEFQNYLIEHLSVYGITISESTAQQLLHFLTLVLEKNRVINLTRIADFSEGIDKHLIDSLLPLIPLSRIPLSAHPRFLDIGTGAGFPGFPRGIVTRWNGLLIDSTVKKIRAVQEFLVQLNLSNIQAYSIRAEELARQQARSFDLVCARAVADTSVLLEYASPLLKNNGWLCVMKGLPSEEEQIHAKCTAQVCGFHAVSRETVQLPSEHGTRTLFLFQKSHKSAYELPRQNGMAKKKPLYLLNN